MNRIAIVLLLAAGVAASGCGKKAEEKMSEKLAEKLIEKSLAKDGVKAKVDITGETMSFSTTDADGQQASMRVNGDEMTIEGPDGTTTFRSGGAGNLPQDFPADVYVVPGASVASSMSYPGGVNLSLTTSAAAKEVADRYSAEMKAQGWGEQSSMDTPEVAMLSFVKENRMATVLVQTEDGVTTINLTVATESE